MSEKIPIRRPGRPRREESGDIEQQLVDAAMRMVVQHGPGLTMNSIIAASGLSRKTVYARYPNKQTLMAAVVRKMLTYGLEPMRIPERPDWRESLRDFVRASLHEVCLAETMLLRRLLMLNPDFMEEAKPRLEQVVVRRYMDPLIGFLGRLMETGKIPRQDIPFLAEALTSLVLAESHRRFFQNDVDVATDSQRLDELATKLVRLFCGGIMAGETG